MRLVIENTQNKHLYDTITLDGQLYEVKAVFGGKIEVEQAHS